MTQYRTTNGCAKEVVNTFNLFVTLFFLLIFLAQLIISFKVGVKFYPKWTLISGLILTGCSFMYILYLNFTKQVDFNAFKTNALPFLSGIIIFVIFTAFLGLIKSFFPEGIDSQPDSLLPQFNQLLPELANFIPILCGVLTLAGSFIFKTKRSFSPEFLLKK